MNKIYDCFTFFNELDLLEIRLNILDKYVNYFVICEAECTHSNKEKGFILEQNKERFNKFKDKIIYIKTQKGSFNSNPWHNENLQRNSLIDGLVDAQDDDIILLSDLDEIPNPEMLKLQDGNNISTFTTNLFYGYLNTVVKDARQRANNGTIIFKYKNLKNKTMQYFRNNKDSFTPINNGGWHFSYAVGTDISKAKLKIESFAHQEFNNKAVLNNVENNILNGKDILSRGSQYDTTVDNTLLPQYVIDNKKKYEYLIKS